MTPFARVALLGIVLALLPVRSAAAFTVNSTGNASDQGVNGECWTGAMIGGAKECTLRAAVQEVNGGAGAGTITFSVASITGATGLPTITKPVTIDGGAGRTEIEGSVNGGDVTFVLTASGNVVKRLVLADGIRFENGGGSLLEDCYVGTDTLGTTPRFGAGAQIKDSANNTIRKNVISGNGFNMFGLQIQGPTSTGNTVVGNFIGTDPSGTIQVSNGINSAGVHVFNAPDNTIGGPAAEDANVISGTGSGVVIFGATATGNVVENNLIGPDVTGTTALEEFGGNGVTIRDASDNVVRNNVISGNNNSGVWIEDATGNRVLGNLIGTNAAGTDVVEFPSSAEHRQLVGVRLKDADDNVVGEPGAGNVIAGNEFGVSLEETANGNRIQANKIGVHEQGGALGNVNQGVYVNGADNTIGGVQAGEGNEIAYNGRNGVGVIAGTDNAIVGNRIYANGELGIDLGFNGPTPNDAGDADTGANGLQNFPELAVVGGAVQGTLTAAPGTYRIELFTVEECDPSGFGEAQTLKTALEVTVGGSGIATFNPPQPERGRFLTATATAMVGGLPTSTSEISACAAAAGTGPPKGAFTVDSIGDEPDANPGNGVCATAQNTCTLRAAIQEANVLPKRQTILFALPGSGPFTIKPGAGGLPVVDRALVIDGTSQPGAGLTPVVEIDGSNAGPSTDGLTFSDGKNVVRGLVINRFGGRGLVLRDKPKNVVQGNFIGTDVTGTLARGNGGDGIYLYSSEKNLIGGPAENLGNLIAGNGGHGMFFDSGSDGNVVVGNAVGTNVARTAALANGGSGIVLGLFSAKNVIGAAGGIGNVVSGNGGAGIALLRGAVKHKILGNLVGVDGDATTKIPNQVGIALEDATKNTIGEPETPNVVAGNTQGGIRLLGESDKNDVVGNLVGTNGAGDQGLGNGGPGIGIENGLDNAIEENVVGDNDIGVGISGARAAENLVRMNFIGTNPAMDVDLGNKGIGVAFLNDAHDNVIGGKAKTANVIAGNGGPMSGGGIVMLSGVRNAVRANAIFANEPLNVDLGNDGVGAEDAGDADLGPNTLQNAPQLLNASRSADGLALNGRLHSTPKSKFVVDLFLSAACAGPGGEGERYWKSFKIATGDDGNSEFSYKAKEKGIPPLGFLSATVTDKVGNTSELATCVPVLAASTP